MPGTEGHGKMAGLYGSGPSGWQWKARPISPAAASDSLQLLGLGHDLWIASERVDLVTCSLTYQTTVCVGQVLAAVELGGSG